MGFLDAIYPDIVGDNLDIVFIGFPIATTSTFITGLLPFCNFSCVTFFV